MTAGGAAKLGAPVAAISTFLPMDENASRVKDDMDWLRFGFVAGLKLGPAAPQDTKSSLGIEPYFFFAFIAIRVAAMCSRICWTAITFCSRVSCVMTASRSP